MEIKKADSKGRVTGFEPSSYFRVEIDKYGKITLTPVKYYTEAELQLLYAETCTNDEGGTVLLDNPLVGFPAYEKAIAKLEAFK